jgi:hypothetical protein
VKFVVYSLELNKDGARGSMEVIKAEHESDTFFKLYNFYGSIGHSNTLQKSDIGIPFIKSSIDNSIKVYIVCDEFGISSKRYWFEKLVDLIRSQLDNRVSLIPSYKDNIRQCETDSIEHLYYSV